MTLPVWHSKVLIRKRLWFKSKWTEFPSLHDLQEYPVTLRGLTALRPQLVVQGNVAPSVGAVMQRCAYGFVWKCGASKSTALSWFSLSNSNSMGFYGHIPFSNKPTKTCWRKSTRYLGIPTYSSLMFSKVFTHTYPSCPHGSNHALARVHSSPHSATCRSMDRSKIPEQRPSCSPRG